MNKSTLNGILQKFGIEVHGTGYIQSLKKQSFKEDAFERHLELVGSGSNPIIFDVGANRGDTVAKYLNFFGDASIYAFEPYPDSFNTLSQRYQGNPNIKCFEIAVAESAQTMNFYVNENVDTNSLLKSARSGLSSDTHVKNKSTIRVEAATLDTFCEVHGINSIDILKMDIQGGELSALKGALRLLEGGRIRLLFLEVFFIAQYENQPMYHDLAALLYQQGYVLHDFFNPFYGKGNIAWADAIFLRKK